MTFPQVLRPGEHSQGCAEDRLPSSPSHLIDRSTVSPILPGMLTASGLIVVVQAFAMEAQQKQSGMREWLILVAKKLT